MTRCRIKKLVKFIIALAVLYWVFPFFSLLIPPMADYMLANFTYPKVAAKITSGTDNDWSKVEAINSWLYINEEQGPPLTPADVIGRSPYLDFIRGIGWCDQKVGGLSALLATEGIKVRAILFPSHVIAEVEVDGVDRYYDPTFNTQLLLDNGKFVRLDGLPYKGAMINGEAPRYSSYSITPLVTAQDIVLSSYPKPYMDAWLSTLSFSLRIRPPVSPIGIDPSLSDEYSSSEYKALYMGRVYQLHGEFDKALPYYLDALGDSDLHDEAVYYLITLGEDTGDQVIISKYTDMMKAEIGTGNTNYLSLAKQYLDRLEEVRGK